MCVYVYIYIYIWSALATSIRGDSNGVSRIPYPNVSNRVSDHSEIHSAPERSITTTLDGYLAT